ncbi:MAG: hypothetical protein ACXWUG_00695 [Polyangiales bacterium]
MQRILVVITDDEAVGDSFADVLADIGGFDVMIESNEERAFELARVYRDAMFVFHVAGSKPVGLAFRRARSIDPELHGIAIGVCADDPDAVPFVLEDLPALRLPLESSAVSRFLDLLEFAPPVSIR